MDLQRTPPTAGCQQHPARLEPIRESHPVSLIRLQGQTNLHETGSVPTDQGLCPHDDQRRTPTRKKCQAHPCRGIDPSRLHAALDVQCKLSAKKQNLSLDGLARAECQDALADQGPASLTTIDRAPSTQRSCDIRGGQPVRTAGLLFADHRRIREFRSAAKFLRRSDRDDDRCSTPS
jgi:hypothetical protein